MTRKSISFDVNPLFGGPSLEARNRTGSPFRVLNLSEIDADPDQPRRVFGSDSLEELASSIKQFGVLCPIRVRVTAGGTYKLIAGERRFRAAKLAGLEAIPAVIDAEDGSSDDSLAKQLVENLQREDLTSMERALAIGQLKQTYSLSVREIAARLGVSKSLVQRSLEILSLPDDLQAALIAGAPESKILVLAEVADRAVRKKLLEELNQISRFELELRVKELHGAGDEKEDSSHGGTDKTPKERSEISAEDQHIVEEIQRALGTKVHIARLRNKKEQGRLVIEFYSGEDLDEVFKRLTNR